MRLTFLFTCLNLITLFVLTPFLAETDVKAEDDSEAEDEAEFLNAQGIPPPGANDPECRLEDGENPVILVPGTFARSSYNFLALSPELSEREYCVYAFNYGFTFSGPSTGPIEDSAQKLQTFINNVLELTGADEVDIIGHSQGGMMPRYYVDALDGDETVDNLIAFASPHHGTEGILEFSNITGIGSTLLACDACHQQLAGSDFLNELNAEDETPGGVAYTNIVTTEDAVILPYTNGYLNGPEAQVSNIAVQDYLSEGSPGHIGIVFHEPSYAFALDALENEGPANPERAVERGEETRPVYENSSGASILERMKASNVLFSVFDPILDCLEASNVLFSAFDPIKTMSSYPGC
ncbi:esterase/lipase family protein [Salicibibacter kimchii]|nr:alpha/beta fold hydrolase [Salicibibacter kimchii]